MKQHIFNFPHIDWYRKNILIATEQTQFYKNHYYEYYLQKHIIAMLYRPKKIAEIGVRWGYSAFSFLSASPQAEYTGFDMIGGGHGGAKVDTYMYVDGLLNKNFPDAKINLVYQNTQELKEMPSKYDFIHIDGDHSTNAVSHDMAIGWQALIPGGVMLIDDDVKIKGVRAAVDKFLKKHFDLLDYFYRMPSLTGEVIIRKPTIEKEL